MSTGSDPTIAGLSPWRARWGPVSAPFALMKAPGPGRAAHQKAGLRRPFLRGRGVRATRELLLGSDRVFRRFRDAELDHGLGLDLNGFTGLGIAAHAGFAMRLYQAAESGHHEDTVFLGLLDRGVGQGLEEGAGGFVVGLKFLGQVADELSLGHA